MKLDLGAGALSPAGFVPMGNAHGTPIYPLALPDGSAEIIRASHCLEHFSHRDIGAVIAEWVRVLKPGGKLMLAVPDFERIARRYLAGDTMPIQEYVMGGHVDGADRHGAIFDAECLTEAMRAAGLGIIRPWISDIADCAALPISLNLMGHKAPMALPRIGAAMSVPRLGFMENFFSAFEALVPFKIGLRKFEGAFWGQCLERVMDMCIDDGVDWILTVDYDTVFTPVHVEALIGLIMDHPEADAIAPIQASRHKSLPLMTVDGGQGAAQADVPVEAFDNPLLPLRTAHFGLTLIKVEALKRMPHPWFKGEPAADGKWGEGRIDDDIWFWRQWRACGNSLFAANRIAIGHMELMVRWPGRDLNAIFQPTRDYRERGAPEECWR